MALQWVKSSFMRRGGKGGKGGKQKEEKASWPFPNFPPSERRDVVAIMSIGFQI
jgi:hypothetical protein